MTHATRGAPNAPRSYATYRGHKLCLVTISRMADGTCIQSTRVMPDLFKPKAAPLQVTK